MSVYKGIDVSKWQGRIDWPLVKSDGVQFAMIRSSFGWNEGNTDLLFETNYENATKVGIPVGAYHYSYARTPAEAIKEADFCYSVIKGKTIPPKADILLRPKKKVLTTPSPKIGNIFCKCHFMCNNYHCHIGIR